MDYINAHWESQVLAEPKASFKGDDITIVVLAKPIKGDLMRVRETGSKTVKKHSFTGRDLLKCGLVGTWADRKDIKDSTEYAKKLRGKSQSRYS